jgi:hypothetical protein
MKSDGWLTKEWLAKLDDKDRAQIGAWRSFRASGKAPTTVDGQREAIASCAVSQVGTVNALDRGDNKKFGGERVKAYYQDLGLAVDDGTTAANKFTGGGAWSWCGIFATWCAKMVTGSGSWTSRPSYPYIAGNAAAIAKADIGDILTVVSDDNHMAVIVSKTSSSFICVGGNLEFQGIDYQTFAFSKATGFYQTVASPAPSGGGTGADPNAPDLVVPDHGDPAISGGPEEL